MSPEAEKPRMRFTFVSGASGAGKTTVCSVLTANGYKIFDGDIWCAGGDPINNVDAPVTKEMVASREPAMAKAVTDAISVGRTKLGKGEPVPWEVWESFYTFMGTAIKTRTAQSDHDKWVIPFAVYREVERNFLCWFLSDVGETTFVLLNVPEEVLAERVYKRTVQHARDQGISLEQYLGRFHPGKPVQEVLDGWKVRRAGFEPMGIREVSAFQVDVDRAMTPEMVHAEAARLLGYATSAGGASKDGQLDQAVWYFATGSMMNHVLVQGRHLKPIKSMPAQLMDFKLQFLGQSGFAANVPEPGASTHGVLHLMPAESMKQINEEERGYDRVSGTATCCDGSTISCTVYVVNPKNLSAEEAAKIADAKPPAERYIDRLVEGAVHYGCAPEFVAWLRERPRVPRKPADRLLSLDAKAVAATWSLGDLERHRGPGEGDPWVIGLSGKVLQYVGPRGGKAKTRLMSWSGEDVTLRLAREMYDPKYGMPQTPADISAELALVQEDKFITVWGGKQALLTMFHVVAHLKG
mmetsp:Transcript_31403/g.85204  ORF Transcript_31403/g.85204 Transcript_31403/m.85204 type:complete len:524 (-) Transcript_31403:101-1672(-)|eukprot:CAMPEP_0171171860 /NCGR_PEP_ID=MMETSP0790-20130122/9428_1 /TAXON_ID=2925 /ORGANISM="Alexandrium catenella, Strain OF101" /LENGTH=523 /DNA_ID=CAMNT_0011636713 /DNA_START=82 /DNA_END=1653 /DNA_ORIENTATION=+